MSVERELSKQQKPVVYPLVAVDPGWSTGVAIWLSRCDVISPPSGTATLTTKKRGIDGFRELWYQFETMLRAKCLRNVGTLIIEGQELWTGSAVSYASHSKGYIATLAHLVGVYLNEGLRCAIDVREPILPSEWKGQLTKEALKSRLSSRLGAAYFIGKSEHVIDAIGIGLFTMHGRKAICCE